MHIVQMPLSINCLNQCVDMVSIHCICYCRFLYSLVDDDKYT